MGVSPTEMKGKVLEELASEIREASWELALEVVDEGLRDDTIPSLARLGRLGQLGDMTTFISELANELGDPRPDRVGRGSPLTMIVRDHARQREALGFAPRDIVTEFLLLRRVLWRFVTDRSVELDTGEVLELQRRLNDAIDRLVTECVVAYFDRATSELAYLARHDQLTELLNHAVFTRELELELERASRYKHGTTLVFIDFDRFKEINDTMGHPEGDRVLRKVAGLLRESLRRSDLAGRMGGDEFAAILVESDAETGGRLLARFHDRLDELIASGELPGEVTVSAGLAHYPEEGETAEALFRVADARLYASKRAKAA
jgi:diguanylate cyclase (GGDEF)-like protein